MKKWYSPNRLLRIPGGLLISWTPTPPSLPPTTAPRIWEATRDTTRRHRNVQMNSPFRSRRIPASASICKASFCRIDRCAVTRDRRAHGGIAYLYINLFETGGKASFFGNLDVVGALLRSARRDTTLCGSNSPLNGTRTSSFYIEHLPRAPAPRCYASASFFCWWRKIFFTRTGMRLKAAGKQIACTHECTHVHSND